MKSLIGKLHDLCSDWDSESKKQEKLYHGFVTFAGPHIRLTVEFQDGKKIKLKEIHPAFPAGYTVESKTDIPKFFDVEVSGIVGKYVGPKYMGTSVNTLSISKVHRFTEIDINEAKERRNPQSGRREH